MNYNQSNFNPPPPAGDPPSMPFAESSSTVNSSAMPFAGSPSAENAPRSDGAFAGGAGNAPMSGRQSQQRGGNYGRKRDKLVIFQIRRTIGTLSTSKSGWNKEVNIVAWNDRPARLDIREWNPERTRMSRGVALSDKETKKLMQILEEWYGMGHSVAEFSGEEESRSAVGVQSVEQSNRGVGETQVYSSSPPSGNQLPLPETNNHLPS